MSDSTEELPPYFAYFPAPTEEEKFLASLGNGESAMRLWQVIFSDRDSMVVEHGHPLLPGVTIHTYFKPGNDRMGDGWHVTVYSGVRYDDGTNGNSQAIRDTDQNLRAADPDDTHPDALILHPTEEDALARCRALWTSLVVSGRVPVMFDWLFNPDD